MIMSVSTGISNGSSTGDSIYVEFDEGDGSHAKYELRSKGGGEGEDLDEVSVVMVDDE